MAAKRYIMYLKYIVSFRTLAEIRSRVVGDWRSLPSQSRPNILQRIKTFGANLLLEGFEVETVAIAMLGIGLAFGIRFRIFVLLPIILLDLVAFTAIGITQGISIWSITLMNIIGATCLQLGYLGGALLKFFIRTERFDGTNSSQSARPVAR